MKLLGGIAVVALIATFGDWVWFEIGVQHRPTAGAIHGAVLLGAAGAVLGWLSGRALFGLVAGIASGVGGAAAYYALASLGSRAVNYPAMVAAWAAIWLVLAFVDGRVLRAKAPRGWGECLGRGALAAVGSGLAFWLVLPVIWGGHDDARNYALQFAAWFAAWGTGLGAIASGRT